METWPVSFPAPNEDFSAEAIAGALRTAMDSGAIRQRRRFSVDLTQISISWTLDNIQMAVFSSFHKNRLNLGTDWFIMPLDLGGGMVNHTVRFVGGQYSQQYAPISFWTVSAKMDVLERHTFSSSLLAIYLEFGFTETEIESLLVQIGHLHDLVHVTLPIKLS